MKKKIGITMLIVGFISFITGISISPNWIITGTYLSVIGGAIMGSSTYFFIKSRGNAHI